MKKFSFYACTAATVLFAGSFATAAHGATVDTYNFPGGKAVIIGGGSCNGNFGGGNSDGWQTILGQLQGNLGGGCFNFPNTTQPGGSQQPDMPSSPDAGPITPDEEYPGQSGSISQSEYADQGGTVESRFKTPFSQHKSGKSRVCPGERTGKIFFPYPP